MFTRFLLSEPTGEQSVTYHEYKEGQRIRRILRVSINGASWFDFEVTEQNIETLKKCLKQFESEK